MKIIVKAREFQLIKFHLSAHSTSVRDYKDFKSFFAGENIIHNTLDLMKWSYI